MAVTYNDPTVKYNDLRVTYNGVDNRTPPPPTGNALSIREWIVQHNPARTTRPR